MPRLIRIVRCKPYPTVCYRVFLRHAPEAVTVSRAEKNAQNFPCNEGQAVQWRHQPPRYVVMSLPLSVNGAACLHFLSVVSGSSLRDAPLVRYGVGPMLWKAWESVLLVRHAGRGGHGWRSTQGHAAVPTVPASTPPLSMPEWCTTTPVVPHSTLPGLCATAVSLSIAASVGGSPV